jgi:exosortase F-associated protein
MKRYILIAVSLSMLLVVFIFQRFNFAEVINHVVPQVVEIRNPNGVFILNKTLRLVLNDFACMILIFALFSTRKYVRAAFYLFLLELLVLLPIYFLLKLTLEGDSELSSPLLSHIHRLIVNPLLMFLLIAGFIYQRLKVEKS